MTTILIDGKNALFRFGFANKALHSKSGQPTGAVYGMINCVLRLNRKLRDARFIVVWDGKDAKTHGWRRKLYPEYKANREAPSPEALAVLSQQPLVKEVFTLLGIRQYELDAVEADDLISILAFAIVAKSGCVIYSSDQDFLQLLPFGINVIPDIDKSSPLALASGTSVYNKFGCKPADLLKLRALVGDKSDNIAQVLRGVGEKGSLKLLSAGADPSVPTFESLPSAAQVECLKLKPVWKKARINYRLMRLPKDVREAEMSLVQQSICTDYISEVLANAAPKRSMGYRALISAFANLDLSTAIEHREELWALSHRS